MMREITTWRRTVAILGSIALFAAACGTGDDAPAPAPGTDEEPADPDDPDADDEPAATGDIQTGDGVTEEPCPDAVNPDNGCIYLGVLSDLTEGPFAALAVPITEGQRAFWQRVNEEGGIGGFDVDIDTYTRDNKYDPQEQSSQYRNIEPEILALAQTLGTPTTEAILPDMDDDDMIGIPVAWWSGLDFEEADRGLLLNSGYSYCLESMIGLDWISGERGEPSTVMAVGYPGDYGGDAAAGAEAWAEANGVEYLGFVETAPNAIVGSQDAAVGQIVGGEADIVVIAVGPAETAEIIGGAAANGYEGHFMGSIPTWNPALLQTAAAPALEAMYTLVQPFENFESGTSAAHDAMREVLGGEFPTNDGFTAGWVGSYPMKAALEAAAANGDLTRAGLRSVVDGLEVDYEGALPNRTFGGDPNENSVRVAVIGRPDPDNVQGISVLEADVTGPTADAYDYSSPCIG
jgi:ABC-type branched-subunit amino acid transport system substrate-binding protein